MERLTGRDRRRPAHIHVRGGLKERQNQRFKIASLSSEVQYFLKSMTGFCAKSISIYPA